MSELNSKVQKYSKSERKVFLITFILIKYCKVVKIIIVTNWKRAKIHMYNHGVRYLKAGIVVTDALMRFLNSPISRLASADYGPPLWRELWSSLSGILMFLTPSDSAGWGTWVRGRSGRDNSACGERPPSSRGSCRNDSPPGCCTSSCTPPDWPPLWWSWWRDPHTDRVQVDTWGRGCSRLLSGRLCSNSTISRGEMLAPTFCFILAC